MRTLCFAFAPAKMPSAPRGEDADAPGSLLPAADKSPQALAGSDAPDGPPGTLERAAGQLPSPPLLPTPLPKAVPKATKNVTGGSASVPPPPSPPVIWSDWASALAWSSPFASAIVALDGPRGPGGGRAVLSEDLGHPEQTTPVPQAHGAVSASHALRHRQPRAGRSAGVGDRDRGPPASLHLWE